MPTTIEIFCCYAREYQNLMKSLRKHLMPLQRRGLITIWSDTDIDAGSAWEDEIKKHLDSAHIILLLISPDFMASDYCYSTEMERALERNAKGEARVIPIILRPTAWKGAPFDKLQMLPSNAKPVTDRRSWQNEDEALNDVIEQIKPVVAEQLLPQYINAETQLVESHNYGQAWELYERILSLNPELEDKADNRYFHTKARILRGLQHYDESLAAYIDIPTIAVPRPEEFNLLQTISAGEGDINSIAISPDGTLLASGNNDHTIKLWNLHTGQELLTLIGHSNPVYRVAISPDGQLLASGSGDNIIKLWNPHTGQELRTFTGHSHPVNSVAFSHDGQLLASGSDDKTIKLWNPHTGQELRAIQTEARVYALLFSPDGQFLVSRHDDGTIRVWGKK
ncbi:MAG TPA: TIR domain-containing protein [Ktedonobacteraceae bacterium]